MLDREVKVILCSDAIDPLFINGEWAICDNEISYTTFVYKYTIINIQYSKQSKYRVY